MVTIRDVALASGFSTATVSLVLNDAPRARHIPERTKTKVRGAARRLGYQPNHFARALASRHSQTVGVIVPDITDPYCTQILRGIENTLYRHRFLSILTDIQNDRSRFARYVEMLLARRVEGLILIANSLLLSPDPVAAFERRAVPCALIGREAGGGGIHAVTIDNEAGTRAGLQHLYALGHRAIAFLRGPAGVVDSARRWRGITGFAAEAGLAIDPRQVAALPPPASSFAAGYRATERLLRGRDRTRRWTALMAFDDLTAFGAIRALTKAGLRVPEDCSVVGFDDVAASAFHNPPLTTIRLPLEMLGTMGAESILAAVEAVDKKRPAPPARLRRVLPALIVRESTAPPPA